MGKLLWRRVAVTAVATAVTLTLVNSGTTATMASEGSVAGPALAAPGLAVADPAQDGRNLFQAVFYLAGPEAGPVIELTQAPAELTGATRTAEVAAYIAAVVAEVDGIDASFFARFADQLRSGDPFAVERAIDEGRQLILRANEQLSASVEPHSSFAPNVGWFAVVVAIALAVALGGVVSVQTAVVVAEFWVGSTPTAFLAEGVEGLSHERAVAALTEAFAR